MICVSALTPELDAETQTMVNEIRKLWVGRSSIRLTEFEPKFKPGSVFPPVFRIKPVMENPAATFPNWVIAIYYILALVMWTLVGRVSKHIFPPENSSFFLMKFFVRSTNPLIPAFRLITPVS